MSYSFHLNNAPKLTLSDLLTQPGLSDIKFVDGYPKPQDGRWPLGFTYIYCDKVTARTIEVDYDGDHFQVRIFTASSIEDYTLAVNLIAAVAKITNARITPEDQETVSFEAFERQFDDNWIKSHCTGAMNAVLGMFGNSLERGHKVSGVTGMMTIGPRVYQQIMQNPQTAAETFFYRLKKLNYINDEDIFQSPMTVMHDKASNTNLRLASWTQGVETLLCDRNTVVGLSTGERSSMQVALADIAQLLPDQVLWLSEEILLVPNLTGDQWQAFLKQAESVAITDLSPYSYDPENDPFAGESPAIAPKGVLSQSQMETLIYAPIAVFCLVAGADKKIDSKEINAFQRELIKGVTTQSMTLQKVLMEVVSDFKPLITHLLSDGVDIQNTLAEVVNVLDTALPAEESTSFKVSLLRIGTKVAEASGGVLGVFGDKICKAEKQVLADMAVLFGMIDSGEED